MLIPAASRAAASIRASKPRPPYWPAARSRACVYSACNCSIHSASLPGAGPMCRAKRESRPSALRYHSLTVAARNGNRNQTARVRE